MNTDRATKSSAREERWRNGAFFVFFLRSTKRQTALVSDLGVKIILSHQRLVQISLAMLMLPCEMDKGAYTSCHRVFIRRDATITRPHSRLIRLRRVGGTTGILGEPALTQKEHDEPRTSAALINLEPRCSCRKPFACSS